MLGGAHKEARKGRSRRLAAIVAVLFAVLPPSTAFAHVERASYWPDPAPDTTVSPAAGGKVPEIRGLFSALDAGPVGDTRVVCQGGQRLDYVAPPPARPDRHVSRKRVKKLERRHRKLKRGMRKAKRKDKPRKVRAKKRKRRKNKRKLTKAKRAYKLALKAELAAREANRQALAARQAYEGLLATHPSIQRLDAAIAAARAGGYEIQPSEPPIPFSQAEADQLRDFNARLLAQCGFDSIQAAVNASSNNDRVVVMPGIYTEPDSRAAPTEDPACASLKELNDRGQTGANSYAYVAKCPNDQNLIAVIGREPRHDKVPQPPADDRHGIRDSGPCIRCNLQLEGSGVGPDDVIVDAGRVESGNGAPADPAKDVGIRADRADGFVATNLTVRHVREHALYVHEVDGYVLDRFKTYHAEEYGVLTFTSDHGLISDCLTYGSGDAGIYPGSAPDTGEQVGEPDRLPPDHRRYNTEIRRCDMTHNSAGYSGTAANAVWLHDNDFYGNALGFTTDVFTAAGHPGFPQDSDLIERNDFYSNNFNPYVNQPDADEVVPTIPVPVGTGMWIAGGNNNNVKNNRFWNNWRRGAMLFAVPDSLVCGPGAGGNAQHGCNPGSISTSYRNRFHGNVMGRDPAGRRDRNGTDFWWDRFPGNKNNCWYANRGPDGTRGSLTADPPINPAGDAAPSLGGTFLPGSCGDLNSVATGGPANETELVNCLANFDQGAPTPCTWFDTPPEP